MSDAIKDNDLEVEIDLGELAWSTPARWEDSPRPATKPAPSPAPRGSRRTAPARRTVTRNATAAARRAAPTASAKSAYNLPPAFAELTSGKMSGKVRELVGATFARLLKTLDTLASIEHALTQPRAVCVGLLFEEVKSQSASLLSHLTEAVSGGTRLPRRVRDVFDGMRFVIGHELSKVFRQEFPGLTGETHSYTRADLSRAWGLLHNCLQQTTITLAQALQPGVTGEQLFEDYRSKIENSFTLYRELHMLLQKVSAAERSSGILLKHSLVRHLEHFRAETMHFLMYKDWGEFSRYVDDVKRAFEDMKEFESVLHEFSQYLSTLIHHVGMREALRDVQAHAPEVVRK